MNKTYLIEYEVGNVVYVIGDTQAKGENGYKLIWKDAVGVITQIGTMLTVAIDGDLYQLARCEIDHI